MSSKSPKTSEGGHALPIVIRRFTILAEIGPDESPFEAISAWWNGPQTEGQPTSERIEWEADDHHFSLTIEPQ